MDKLKDLLSKVLQPEDLAKFESMLTEAIDSAVEAKEKEIKEKYDLLSEEFCNKKIAEGVEEAKVALVAEYDEKMLKLEGKINDQLDMFIEEEIVPQTSDETIGKIALNESLLPIVTGMKTLLENNGISVDETGVSLLREAKSEIENLNEDLNSRIKESMTLNEKLEQSAKYILLQEKTEGLKPKQKSRVVEMFESKDFEETEEKVGSFVKFLIESDNAEPEPKKKLDPDNAAVDPKKEILNESKKEDDAVITDDIKQESNVIAVASHLI